MAQIKVVDKGNPIDGICESGWSRNKCPNKAEFVLRNTTNNGYGIMCGVHKDGFFATYPKADTEAIPVSSIEDIQRVINEIESNCGNSAVEKL